MKRPSHGGTRVGGGRLRVDAARAVDKLRDYQLPDPTMWVLEVVRAAVLAKAERIRVQGDADDVLVAWDGPPVDASELVRLFDELVDPSPSLDRRHLRLLATGVNTALGLGPRWIDLVACTGEGEADVVRYSPRLLEQRGDQGALGLRELAAEKRVLPPHAPARGMLVHLRRLPLLSAVPILVGFGEPTELSVVRRACDDIRVPLTVGRTDIGRDRSHGDLLRMELGEGLDGFLALLDPSHAEDEGRLLVAELGVLLARYSLPIAGLTQARARVPLRLFVDAPRMPANASRSAVRIGEAPVRDAVARAGELLPALVERLVRELGEEASHAWTDAQRERLRASALALLAVGVAGDQWRSAVRALASSGAFGAAVAPLASQPLLRDALGRPRSPASFPVRARADVVHYGADPVPLELAPWLEDVPWIPPGDGAAALLGATRPPSAKDLVARARGFRRARESWLSEKARPLEIAEGPTDLLSVPLAAPGVSLKSCVPQPVFRAVKGLKGQVVLLDPRLVDAARVSLRIDGREIESCPIALPVPLLAVAQSDELRPSPDYRGAERDEALEALLSAVRGAAVVAAESIAARVFLDKAKRGDHATLRWRFPSQPSEHDRAVLARIVRAGVAMALDVLEREQDDAALRRAGARLRASKSPLLHAKVWPVAGGEPRSLHALIQSSQRRPNMLAFASPSRAQATPPSTRAVHLLDAAEARVLAALVHPAVLVDYGPVLAMPAPDPLALARARARPRGAALVLRGEDHVPVIAWTDGPSALEVRHMGMRLALHLLVGTHTQCDVAVDDHRLAPNDDWTAPRVPHDDYPLEQWERALACAFVDALAGNAPPELVLGAPSAAEASLARGSLLALVRAEPSAPAEWLGTKRLAALHRVPLLSLLHRPEPASLGELAARFPEDPIPYVPPDAVAPGDLGEWHPLRATEGEAAAYARLLDRAFAPAADELVRRWQERRRAEALARHRALPLDAPPMFGEPSVTFGGKGFLSAVVANAVQPGPAQVEVRVEGRRFRRIEVPGLPLRAMVDLDASAVGTDPLELTEVAQRVLGHVLARGAREILRREATERPSALLASARLRELLLAWAGRKEQPASERGVAAVLAAAPMFPTIHGEHTSAADAATTQGVVRVASFDQAWLGPLENVRESAYDRGVIRLPAGERAEKELRSILSAIWAKGPIRDVSAAVARLQTERRIERGLVEAPRLPQVRDPRFRYPLESLLARDPETADAIGIGEAAFDDGPRARLTLFEAGAPHATLELHVVPRVIIAAESPIARRGRAVTGQTKERLEEAMRTVTSLVIRRVVDDTPPDELPEWVRRELRASCLQGASDTHFDRLAKAPMFETTRGAWVTPDDLRAQHGRFGPIWWTADHDTSLAPLDEARFALRLRKAEAAQLGRWIGVIDATHELELDQRARRNRDRPPLASLEPSEREHALAVSVLRLRASGGDTSQGVVLVLRPGAGAARGMYAHRELRPLGKLLDPAQWPALARIEEPALVPDRTWEQPEETMVLALVELRVRAAVEAELGRIFPSPEGKTAQLAMRDVAPRELGLREGAVLEGRIWLEAEHEGGRVRLVDAGGERVIEARSGARAVPVAGAVWLDGARFGAEPELVRNLYRLLIAKLAPPPSPSSSDSVTAHVLHGVAAGILDPAQLSFALPCFVPAPCTVAAILAHLGKGGLVRAAPPSEASSVVIEEGALPIFVDDGSRVARAISVMLEGRMVSWREALRAHVLNEPVARAPALVGGAAEPASFEARFAARLRAAGLPAIRVAVASRRKKPLVAMGDGVVELAGAHPAVRAARDAGPDDALAALFVARVAGLMHRRAGTIGAGTELAVLHALFEGR